MGIFQNHSVYIYICIQDLLAALRLLQTWQGARNKRGLPLTSVEPQPATPTCNSTLEIQPATPTCNSTVQLQLPLQLQPATPPGNTNLQLRPATPHHYNCNLQPQAATP